MELKVTRYDNKTYSMQDKVIVSSKTLGDKIREGFVIRVHDLQGYDWTKETLVDIAFNPVLSNRMESTEEVKDALCHFISEDNLYTIIENGGLREFVLRLKKGMLNVNA